MARFVRLLSAALCLVLPCAAVRAQEPLAQQVAALLSDPAVSRAHWGIMVTTLDGTPLYRLNEAQFFQPASNAKLYTTAAAMALLGPEKTFETKVVAEGDLREGVLQGDLVLVGGGDANLSDRVLPYLAPGERPKGAVPVLDPLHHLAEFADQIAATGLKTISGDIIGDDTLFPYEPFGADWAIDDAVWGYGAPVSALTVTDNQMKLTMTPGAVDHEATVVLAQVVPYYMLDAHVMTDKPKSKQASVQVERAPGSRRLRVYGTITADVAPEVEEVAIDEPAEYAALALKTLLEARGVLTKGKAVARHRQSVDAAGFLAQLYRPGQETAVVNGDPWGGSCISTPPIKSVVLAVHPSPAVKDDVVFTNKTSQNLHAELLLHQLGRRAFCAKGSTVEGARIVRAFLLHAGLDKDDFVFYDGSGLSGHDLVTPRATAKLLSYATTQPWFAAWKASLPIGGVDGSLTNRFKDAPLKGHVFAKTGTLGEARALSGYLDCASGKTVIFSIMDSMHTPGSSADREIMDRIVAAIAAAN